VDTLEVDAQEVESVGLCSEDLTLESLEAKSFVLTSEDLSLSSKETKSLGTYLGSQEVEDCVPYDIYDSTRDHLGKFNEKADDGFFLGEDDESIFKSSTDDDYFPYIPAFDPLSTNNITILDLVIPTNTSILQDINSSDEPPEFSIADDHLVHNEPGDTKPADDLEPAEVLCDSSVSQDITINEPINEVEPS
nr:hypothetical protein [Tanacetum cinerariifolium]